MDHVHTEQGCVCTRVFVCVRGGRQSAFFQTLVPPTAQPLLLSHMYPHLSGSFQLPSERCHFVCLTVEWNSFKSANYWVKLECFYRPCHCEGRRLPALDTPKVKPNFAHSKPGGSTSVRHHQLPKLWEPGGLVQHGEEGQRGGRRSACRLPGREQK